MAKALFDAEFKGNGLRIKIVVDLIEFSEEGVFYVYCPSLNLYGYDKTQALARSSFNHVLKEYFRYTTNKKTLEKDLKKNGWSIKKGKNPVYKTPDLSKLLRDNEEFVDIINTHDYKKYSKELSLPVNT